MRRVIGSLIAIVFLAHLGIAPAQQTPPAIPAAQPDQLASTPDTAAGSTIRVAVDLVLLDVRVTDKAGKPIKGLKPEQFTLLEDNKPQKVSSLEYYDIEAMETASVRRSRPILVPIGNVAPAPEPEVVRQAVRDHRMIVLFFDLTSMEAAELVRARDAAERFVREQITPADLVGMAVFGNQLKIVSHFTDDRDALLRAIRSLRPGKETALAPLADAAALPGETNASEDTGVAYTADETEFNIFNTDRKLAAVESLSNLLRRIPGNKSIVHFTGGITQTGEENRLQLEAAIDAANRANVSLYTVDARGLFTDVPGGDATHGAAYGTGNFTSQGFSLSTQAAGLRRNKTAGKAMFSGAAVYEQTAARHDSRDTLATLALDTGGKPFFDLNDLSNVFRAVQGEDKGYYLLGYYSTNAKADGRWRRIHVSVSAAHSNLRYREGYYANRALGLSTSEDRERQLLEALRTDNPRVELPVAVETDHFRLNDKETYVPIAAKLLFSELEWTSKRGKHEAVFDFAAEMRDVQTNRVVAALRDTVKVSLNADRFQQLQQRPIIYQGGVVVAPGTYRLKFIAREDETGRIGSFQQDVVVPKLDDGKIELSSVLLSSQIESVSGSPEVTRRGLGNDARLKTTPLETSGERIVPSVTRVFTTNQELYVFFQAYLPQNIDGSKVQAGLVFYRGGQYATETPLVAPVELSTKTRTASFRVNLPLDKLAPGGYTIQAVVVQEDGDQAAFARNVFAVRLTPTAPVIP